MTATPSRRSHRIRRLAVAALALALAVPAGLAVHRRLSGNLGTVVPGRVLRSAQLTPDQLRDVVRAHGIRTVLNLRGPNPDQPWYRDELRATLDSGAVQVDVPLASDHWLSRSQVRTLLDLADHAAYPLLVHCEFGAERTGLVSALLALLQPGSSLDDARAQFSPAYLFVALKDGRVMQGHLDAYAAWLAANRLDHDPDTLRRWLAEAYRPGSPSRDEWPCDPYPRRVTTTRGPDGLPSQWVEWAPEACPQTRVATRTDEPAREARRQ
jgi:protein tyrosine/serine phosphatase